MGLKYLPGLRWVGSLSIQDADLLAYHGYNSDSVLEFGVGGSTLIFGQTSRRVVSVDTSGEWIELIRRRANTVGCSNITFSSLSHILDNPPPQETFDFVFVDGVSNLRLLFAQQAWKWLKVGGTMAFHDANKPNHIGPIGEFMVGAVNMIDTCALYPLASDGNKTNLAVFTKKPKPAVLRSDYSSWMQDEINSGRPEWSFGSNSNHDLMWEYDPNG